MKISFSTLACPTWTMNAVIETAARIGFDGIELRFIENEDRLWHRPEFHGPGLQETRRRLDAAGLRIACVDTSCYLHHSVPGPRREALEMGRSMIELAAALGAPGIRVFGDRIQEGENRFSTVGWIAEGIRELASFGSPAGVQVWLESHGDFARARDTLEILNDAGAEDTGAVWDPVNAFSEFGEDPREGFSVLGKNVRHVHIKDARRPAAWKPGKPWDPVLMGAGEFPACGLVKLLHAEGYDGFVSFEWEKRWHPDIPEPVTALPHFMDWMKTLLET